MKVIPLIISLLLFFGFSLKADEQIRERVYIYTDKECYIAGEDIRLKFYVINSNFQPSLLSKVGYVEICDTEKPQMQLKVALEKGNGAGEVKIPTDLSSGFYRLSGYTRYMRNEGDTVSFHKLIAIINAGQQIPDPKRFEPVERYENIQLPAVEQSDGTGYNNLLIYTDKKEYSTRTEVVLSLDNIPDNTADLVISVCRNDSIVLIPEINKSEWLKLVKDTFSFSQQWLSEYEGHIISGQLIPNLQEKLLLSDIAFVGNDIRYFNGQINLQNGTVNFYTAGVFGKQQIVTSVISSIYNKIPCRLDLLTPFSESLPDNLPALRFYPNEKQLIERYIGVQIKEKRDNDTLNNVIQPSGYTTFQPVLTYDLNEYTRFNTISETILEFINRVRVARVGNSRRIKVFLEESQRFNYGNTLVLLDGIPIHDHEEILRYNPMHVKKVKVYDGRYLFGGEDMDCIVSFITTEGNLPFFQLNEGSQLFDYDCPQLPSSFEIPDYSNDEIRNSRKPDFRHTLYWNPFVEFPKDTPANFSFYTSDLCGEFKVAVEGITTDGEIIRGVSYFQVAGSFK